MKERQLLSQDSVFETRRRFIVKASLFTGGTLLASVLGCSGVNQNKSQGLKKNDVDDESLGVAQAGATAAPSQIDVAKLIESDKQVIRLSAGVYSIDFDKRGTVISKTSRRKIIGTGTGGVIVRLLNVPSGSPENPFVCIDFQNKTRISNIIFEIVPKISANTSSAAANVTALRFRRVLTRAEVEALGAQSSAACGASEIGDEADMDSSFSNCQFIGRTVDMNELGDSMRQGVTAVEYVGRNLLCKDNFFTSVGTALKLSFPNASQLTDPNSACRLSQGSFYGHRKCRISRSTFRNISRVLHVAGNVTVRGMIVSENEVTGGQFIFCDGAGGIRNSIISENSVVNHIEKGQPQYDSTIAIYAGYFDDNMISDNIFRGNPSKVIHIASSAITSRGNMITENEFSGSSETIFLDNNKETSSVIITMNLFRPWEGSTPRTPVTLGLRQNQVLYNNDFRGLVTDSEPLTVVHLIGGAHRRVLISRNKPADVQVIQTQQSEVNTGRWCTDLCYIQGAR